MYASPEDRTRLITLLRAHGRLQDVEARYRAKSGRVGELSVSAELIHLAGEQYLLSMMMDITERKRTEQKLRESEEQFRMVVENSRDGINLLDLQTGRYILMSPAQVALTGFTREEINNISAEEAYERVHPDDRHISIEQQKLVAERELSGITVEYRWKVKNGEYRWFSDSRRAVRDAQGNAIALVGISRDITERKLAEQTLREREQKLTTVFDLLPVGVSILNAQRQVIEVNTAVEKILTMSREGLVRGDHAKRKFLREDGAPLSIEEFPSERALRAKETTHNIPIGVVKEDGSTLWTTVSAAPLPYGGAVIVTNDMTERKQAEAQQVKLAERLELATRSAQIGIWDWDIQNNVLVWDERMYELYGRRQSEFGCAYEAWLQGVHPDDRTASDQISERARRGEIEYDTEFRVILPDGSVRWLKATGQTYRDEHGTPLRMIGVNYDITARKQAEEKLRESEEKYRGLMETLDSVVAMIDASGKFLYMNEIAAKQLGGTPQTLIGKTLYELFPEPSASRQLQGVRQVIRENQGRVSEFPNIVRGERRWFRNSIQPIHDEHGQAVYALVHATDIHELKTTQQELAELNRTLEARIKQATAEIQDLYDNAPTGYHSLDAQGKIVMINQTELNWLGYTRAELVGQPFARLFTPASLATFYANFPIMKQRGWVRNLEFELIRNSR